MTGNLAYEVHGPIADYTKIYSKIWELGAKFGAVQQGQHCYCLFNHTEAGLTTTSTCTIRSHGSRGEGLATWCAEHLPSPHTTWGAGSTDRWAMTFRDPICHAL